MEDRITEGRKPLKGRGAVSNADGRYESRRHVDFDDGWDSPQHERRPKTEVQVDASRGVLVYNQSPDLPFDRSVNPYRGCEHGCIYCFARPTHAYLGL
ncbi:MAG: radical SAM protein, partial [Gammaproteobacteria bacterium]